MAKVKTVSRTITNTTATVTVYDVGNDSVNTLTMNLGSGVTVGISKKAIEKIAQEVVNDTYENADLKVLKVEGLESSTMKYTIPETVFIEQAVKIVPVTTKESEEE